MFGKNKDRGMSSAELSSFCGQVALILEAGLPLYDGMETLAEADSASTNEDMYRKVSEGVTETGSLYEALRRDERWPAYLTEMVRAGEQSGQLEKVMRGLETYYERNDRIRSSIVSAVTYPMVLGVMLVVIVLVLLWRVLPVFRRVLDSMGVGLNDTGRVMMRAGSAVGWVVLALVAAVVLAVGAVLILLQTGRRQQVLKILWKMFPAVKKVSDRLSASRVASVLSMMLSSGFPTQEALEMAAAVLDDQEAARHMEQVHADMEEGKTFAEALTASGLFGDLECRMIRVGSVAGRDDQVLGRMADQYEEQAEQEITRLVSVIEPSLVALLAVVIGAVLLSVMLPMAGILSSL